MEVQLRISIGVLCSYSFYITQLDVDTEILNAFCSLSVAQGFQSQGRDILFGHDNNLGEDQACVVSKAGKRDETCKHLFVAVTQGFSLTLNASVAQGFLSSRSGFQCRG